MVKLCPVRVLIVDDNELNARALKRALNRRHHVRTVHSADQALAEIERDPPEVVVCDFELGTHTATELLRTVTTRFPGIRRVLYSASLPERWSELVAEKLIDIALGKPTSIEQIFAALER
jgi:DNA-binding NtrC family response regulator